MQRLENLGSEKHDRVKGTWLSLVWLLAHYIIPKSTDLNTAGWPSHKRNCEKQQNTYSQTMAL